jgi:hypothetical protein
VLDANGEQYTYHTDNQQTVVYCEIEKALQDAESSETVNLAKEDLAQRLGISIDRITLIAVIGMEFPSNAFNCQTSKERAPKEEPLYLIIGETILLSAAGHKYEYHASGETVVFCRQLN